MSFTVSYAQNREDIIIDAFFKQKQKGFYVDVGANHPTIDSVTKYFYEKGWNGINIEPIPELAALLKIDRLRDVTLCVGISSESGSKILRSYDNALGLSTVSEEIKNDTSDKVYQPFKEEYKDIKIETSTLAAIMGEHVGSKPIDFMKVDVEGLEYEVLAGNNWTKFSPELICIEANHIIKDWNSILLDQGYVKFFNDGLNDYYAKKESKLLKEFSFPESVFMVYPKIVPFIPSSEKHQEPADDHHDDSPRAERIGIKQSIKWSILAVDEAINLGLRDRILLRKRMLLDQAVQGTDAESLSRIRRHGFDLKLLILKIASRLYGATARLIFGVVRKLA